jgi:hypothetical protein
MICPTCASTNERSTVRVIRTTPGALPKDHFWDEDGNEHSHNPNVIVTEYQCSNSHRFAERSSWECCVCGYKACEAEIVVATQPETPAAAEGPPVRSSSGRVISSAERAAINQKKGR